VVEVFPPVFVALPLGLSFATAAALRGALESLFKRGLFRATVRGGIRNQEKTRKERQLKKERLEKTRKRKRNRGKRKLFSLLYGERLLFQPTLFLSQN
jgi:hypothetical protein